MEKNSQYKNIVLGVLLVAVVTLSIAYAALSQTLSINGQATVKAGTNWNVGFVKTGTTTCTGSGYATVTQQPTIIATSFTGLKVDFKAPGDKVTCTWNVANNGTINAYLKTLTKPSTYSYSGASADVQKVNGNIIYSLTKSNGTAIGTGKTNGALNAGSTLALKLVIEYDSNAQELPADDVVVTGFDTTLIYEQN